MQPAQEKQGNLVLEGEQEEKTARKIRLKILLNC